MKKHSGRRAGGAFFAGLFALSYPYFRLKGSNVYKTVEGRQTLSYEPLMKMLPAFLIKFTLKEGFCQQFGRRGNGDKTWRGGGGGWGTL